jgi:serine phosphatase RsbU (regulator of sigma subunit)
MNLLGRRSLSSFFKALLDIGFSVLSVAFVVLVVFSVVTTLGHNRQIRLPVQFDLAPSAYRMYGQGGAAVDGHLVQADGSITITGPTGISLAIPFVGAFVSLAVALVTVHRLRGIFQRLVEGQPFLQENARSLRFIGLAIVVGELAFAGFQYLGQWSIARHLSSQEIAFHARFSPNLSVILAGLALLIVAEIIREGIKMRTDLETAREIQTSLVAAESSQHGTVRIQARMRPAAEIGGDYYDVIDLDDGRLAFVVADVAGKGLPAALLMMLLRGSLRSLLAAGLRGSALITALNRHLVGNTPDNRMVTCFYGELESTTGRLTYVNAGHNPPYLVVGGEEQTLNATSMVLGMFEALSFEEASAELPDGARLLLYTDGITEAENQSGDQFGTERLEEIVAASASSARGDILDATIEAVLRFRGSTPQSDDMTLMLVSRQMP